MGKIPEGYLPPKELWPTRFYTLPEYKAYPQKFNSTEELIDKQVAGGKGDRVAILFEDRKIPYKALLGMVNKLGNSLKALGIEEADRVALRAPNIPPALVTNFAVLKIGGVFLPTSGLFSRAEIAHVFNNAEVKAVVVAAPMLEELEKAKPDLKTLQHIIVVGGTPEQQAACKEKGYLLYQELVDSGKPECDPVRRDRMDVSVLLYTSGTTGPPKGTAHFNEEALIVPDGFGKYCWGVTENDVILSGAPIAMAAGYSAVASIPFRFGAAVSIFPRFTPEGVFEQIQNHKATIFSALPTAYRKMHEVPGAEQKYDLSTLRICTGGGESLTAKTYEDWKAKFGQEIFEGLGTTEMMFVFISSAATKKVKPGSIGPAIPGYEIRVINEEGKDCKPGETGQLVARGPTGTVYWRDPEKQQSVVKEGWCRAGDMVTMDEDGYIWFLSREDDLIKSSGYRIGPEEIEDVLVTHPAVADAGVVGAPDATMGQKTKAYVQLKEGKTGSEDLKQELIEFCRGKVAVYKLPREVEFTDKMPRAPGPGGPGTGKLLRRVLRQREG
ncbi:MAG: acyl-CoA synthetase [Candidatus Methylomirabilales bacterium]|nr:acyl-CoA synthetase [candidate division NC10 bacterium]MCZ6551472.1 acyl-CoA synthetase [candidate division NC10 bacterium]